MKWNKERQDFLVSLITIQTMFLICKVFGILTLSWFWIWSPLWVSFFLTVILKVWFEIFIMGRGW